MMKMDTEEKNATGLVYLLKKETSFDYRDTRFIKKTCKNILKTKEN